MRLTEEQKIRKMYKHLYNCFSYILILMELFEEKIAELETRIESMERIVYDIRQKLFTANIYKEVVEEVKEKIKKRSYSSTT